MEQIFLLRLYLDAKDASEKEIKKLNKTNELDANNAVETDTKYQAFRVYYDNVYKTNLVVLN